MNDTIKLLNSPIFLFGETSITLGQVLIVPLIVIIGVLFIRWSAAYLRSQLAKRHFSPDVVQMLSRAYLVVAVIILLISGLDLLNVPITTFAFVSGAIAIGVGFGAQNIINNFISGWILMWERPIRIGDFLELGDAKGTVEAINTRSTRIRRVDGVHMLVPNSSLLENTVVNWTLVDHLARTGVKVGVAYGSPARKVAELIGRAAQEHPEVLREPKWLVVFEDFGDNALIFDLYFWVNATGEKDLRLIRSDLRFRIDELFREQGISIAYPQRDVHLDGQLTISTRQA